MATPKNQDTPPLVSSSSETPPSQRTHVVASADGFDFDAFDAEAARAQASAASLLEIVNDDIRTGEYSGVPHALVAANYHFIRVGLRGQPKTDEKAQQLRAYGYVEAPAGVKAIGSGFVRDGDRALIMCGRPEAHKMLRDAKLMKSKARRGRLQKKRLREIEDQLRSSLPRGTDLHVAATMREGSRASFDADLRAVERDIPSPRGR